MLFSGGSRVVPQATPQAPDSLATPQIELGFPRAQLSELTVGCGLQERDRTHRDPRSSAPSPLVKAVIDVRVRGFVPLVITGEWLRSRAPRASTVDFHRFRWISTDLDRFPGLIWVEFGQVLAMLLM